MITSVKHLMVEEAKKSISGRLENSLKMDKYQKILALFRKLVTDGNTVIIIEHRLELIAQADYIIEMGQGGEADGGEVVFAGTPEDILTCEQSKTGKWIGKMM